MVEVYRTSLIEIARHLKREPGHWDEEKAIPVLKRIFNVAVRLTKEHGSSHPIRPDWRGLAVRITDPDQPSVTVWIATRTLSAKIEVEGINRILYVFKEPDGEMEGVIESESKIVPPKYVHVGLEGALQYQAVIKRVQQQLRKTPPEISSKSITQS